MNRLSLLWNKAHKTRIFLGTIALATLAGGCSYDPSNKFTENGIEIYDPLEEQNRRMMAFNQSFDKTVLNPVLRGYRTVTPKPARTGVSNVLRHLGTPVVFTNQLLQADFSGAKNTALRGVINTFVGLGGLFDVAAYEGIEYEHEDFGQTLAVWGVDYGPYMVVPFIGASSLRDYGGYFADSAIDPVRWYLTNVEKDALYYGKFSVNYLDLRDSLMDTLNEVEASSLDYYAATRSIYYQNRNASILDQRDSSELMIPSIPDYDEDEFDY